MKRIIGIVVILVIALSVTLSIRLRQLRAYSLAAAGGSGVIEATEVNINARIPGRLQAVLVREGDEVREGQVLAELDCAEPRAALAQVQAGVSAAQAAVEASRAGANAATENTKAARQAASAAEFQVQSVVVGRDNTQKEAARVESLTKAGALSESRLDQIQSQLSNLNHQIEGLKASTDAARSRADAARRSEIAAQAQILAAQSQVAASQAAVERAQAVARECTLTAPKVGVSDKAVVQLRAFEPGESVLPGATLFTLVEMNEVRASFYLPNAELASASLGQGVTVRADAYPEKKFHGKIRFVSQKAEFTPRNVQTREDRDRLVYAVEVTIPNQDRLLRPGMPVEVAIDGTERKR